MPGVTQRHVRLTRGATTSSIGELFLAHMCIRCMAIPTPHIISIIWPTLSYTVLIDVSLSHPFCLPPPLYLSLCHPKCQL